MPEREEDSLRRLSIVYFGDPKSIHIRRWLGYFSRCGHTVTLLVPRGEIVNPPLPDGVRVERFDAVWPLRPTPRGLWRSLRGFVSLRRTVRRLRPDLVHGHYLTVHGWHAWLAGRRPYAITVWGSDVLVTATATFRGRIYARLSLRGAGLVTGNTAHLVAAAVDAGARPERSHMIHFGVDAARFGAGDASELRNRLGLAGRRVVLSPRTMAPLYHHDVVLRAAAELPRDTVVVMTAHLERPGVRAGLEALADELGMRERLVILPPVGHVDMPDLYRLADVVVSVPETDAAGVTILEALATGKPVVAADVPSVREWLEGLDEGALVPVGDVAATRAALARALSRNPDEAAAFAARARALVLERGDETANMSRAEALCITLVEESRHRP